MFFCFIFCLFLLDVFFFDMFVVLNVTCCFLCWKLAVFFFLKPSYDLTRTLKLFLAHAIKARSEGKQAFLLKLYCVLCMFVLHRTLA